MRALLALNLNDLLVLLEENRECSSFFFDFNLCFIVNFFLNFS